MNYKKQIIIISSIFGLISIALVFFVIYPLIKEIKESSKNTALLDKEMGSSQNQEKNLSDLKDFYNSVEPNVVKMDNLFVDSQVPIELIKFLEKTAADQNISIEINAVSPKKEGDGLWNYILFQATLKGSYTGFLRFLEKIESGPFLNQVTTLSIAKADSGQSADKIGATFSIKIFVK
jgi:Tfp pilus assembly protein PilO